MFLLQINCINKNYLFNYLLLFIYYNILFICYRNNAFILLYNRNWKIYPNIKNEINK